MGGAATLGSRGRDCSGTARAARCGRATQSGGGPARHVRAASRRGLAWQSWPGSARVVWPVTAWKATQSRTACLGQAAPGASWQSKAVEASAACLVAAGKATQRSQGPSRPGLAGLDRSWMVRQSRWSRQVQFGQRTFRQSRGARLGMTRPVRAKSRQSWLVEVLRGEAS